MHNRLKKPCNDCPFRRCASPGWLGSSGPEWFVESALADDASYSDSANAAPCHLTVDYTKPKWRETLAEADACVGSLQFAANNCKSPRDPVRGDMVRQAGTNPEVFRTRKEFVDHHTSPTGMRSWESDEEWEMGH